MAQFEKNGKLDEIIKRSQKLRERREKMQTSRASIGSITGQSQDGCGSANGGQ